MELMFGSQLTLLVCMTLFGNNVEVTANTAGMTLYGNDVWVAANTAGMYDLMWN